MNKSKYIPLLAALFGLGQELKGQSFADCGSPFILGVNEYRNDGGAGGPGSELEISGNDFRNLYFIEKEHNTVWYKFTAVKDGMLSFIITPDAARDDCDFMLFKQENDDFCGKVKSKSLQPVRTNFARGTGNGATGLKQGAVAEYKGAGPGNNFCKPYGYKKGDVFYLLVDNVYFKGKGHTIKLNGFFDPASSDLAEKKKDSVLTASNSGDNGKYEENLGVRGKETDKGLDKNLDKTTSTVAETEGESGKTGVSDIEAAKALAEAGGLTADGKPRLLDSGKTPEALKNSLSNLKIGQALILENVYFHGNSAFLKTESKEHIDALYDFLKANPSVKIAIGGHTNGHQKGQTHYIPDGKTANIFSKDQFSMLMEAKQVKGNTKKLSEYRATVIKDYLETKGIAPDRIIAEGWGADKMIFGEDSQMGFKNRRVEVEIKE